MLRETPGLERRLERAVLAQDLGGALRTDARRARELVGGVTPERDEVGHLLGLDAVALAHLRGPDAHELAHAPGRHQQRHAVGGQLEDVPVGGDDENRAPPAALRHDGRGEEVVRLVSGRLGRSEAEGTDELGQHVELLEERGVEHATALVRSERLVPVRRNRERVPADEHRARLLASRRAASACS